MSDQDFFDEDDGKKSKSERKREMLALQKLGQQMTEFKEGQLAEFPIDDDLRKALLEYKRLTQNEARRRQLQFIGKLMRKVDAEAIQNIIDRLLAPQRQDTYQHHLTEQWRERLLSGSNEEITAFIDQFPSVDRQAFRQLVMKAVAEKNKGENRGESKKLFQFLKRTILDATFAEGGMAGDAMPDDDEAEE